MLVPLAEIAPDRVIAGRTARQALAGLSTEGIERLPADLGLTLYWPSPRGIFRPGAKMAPGAIR